MAINFPNAPTLGELYVNGSTTWEWNGTTWDVVGSIAAQGPTGPKGDTGETGAVGATGPTGAQGIQGLQGDTGPMGATGPVGSQGIQGAVGPTGPQGEQGLRGIQGETGLQGATGDVGPTGPAGLTGSQGDVGPTGPTGPTGPNGTFNISDAEPVNPSEGDIWFNSIAGKLLIFYDNFWVETIAGEVGPTGPAGPDIYAPANQADWDTAPTSISAALDELASRLRNLQG